MFESTVKENNTEVKINSTPKQSVLTISNGNVQVSSKSKKRKIDENTVPSKQRRLDGIYEDGKPLQKKQKTHTSVAVQTEKCTIINDGEATTEKCTIKNEGEATSPNSPDKAETILKMLTDETASAEYWEALAEKRREALEESLIENERLVGENESLVGENDGLKKQVEDLKTENEMLEEMANEAKELAQMVQELTSDNQDVKDDD